MHRSVYRCNIIRPSDTYYKRITCKFSQSASSRPVHTVTSRTRGMGKGLKAAQPLHLPSGFYVFRAAFALGANFTLAVRLF